MNKESKLNKVKRRLPSGEGVFVNGIISACIILLVFSFSATAFSVGSEKEEDVVTTTATLTTMPTTTEMSTETTTTTEKTTSTTTKVSATQTILRPTTTSTTKKVTTTTKASKSETTILSTTKSITTKTHTNGTTYSIPSHGGKFKSYTNYKLLSKKSPQWLRVQCNSNAYTDSNGLRKVGDYYCVAMGSYYTRTLGDLFRITTENGVFNVIITDFKANAHTDSTHRYTTANNCVIEFYVDMGTLNPSIKRMGDCSYAENRFKGKITKIEKVGNYFT